MTYRELVADHLRGAEAQLRAALRVAKATPGLLTDRDLARLAELHAAVSTAAENVRESRDGLLTPAPGRLSSRRRERLSDLFARWDAEPADEAEERLWDEALSDLVPVVLGREPAWTDRVLPVHPSGTESATVTPEPHPLDLVAEAVTGGRTMTTTSRTRTRENWAGERVPPERWARDHWSTIAYAFTCVGSHGGTLDAARMRTKPGDPSRGHRGHEQSAMARLACGDREYPTRLQGGVDLYGHDDWDCLLDAEAAGVLSWGGSGAHPVIVFSPAGLVLGAWLCRCIDQRIVSTMALTWDRVIQEIGDSTFTTASGPLSVSVGVTEEEVARG